ncbi:hypothetical protein SRHO_G00135020 [Serrasalmus rhombeus]
MLQLATGEEPWGERRGKTRLLLPGGPGPAQTELFQFSVVGSGLVYRVGVWVGLSVLQPVRVGPCARLSPLTPCSALS